MFKSKFIELFVIILLFLGSLYLVEVSPIGAGAVASKNGGYGTFDMKKYDYNTVCRVLSSMDKACRKAYVGYYIADYIFIIFFGLFQGYVLYLLYISMGTKIVYMAELIPLLRGLFDIVENALLLKTVLSYPKLSELAVNAASLCTSWKLFTIKIWVVEIVAGILLMIVRRIIK